MPRIPKKLRAKFNLTHGLIIRDKLKVSILLFTITSPSLLPERCLWRFTGIIIPHTGLLSGWMNRRIRKHRPLVHFRKLLRFRGNEDTWYTAFPNIPLPSWKFLHLFIILECITLVLWMQIFDTILTTTVHNLVLKTKRMKACGITFACFVITIKHDLIQ